MHKLWLAVLLPGLAAAAVWPETMGPWKRTEVQAAAVDDRPLWDEYGLKEAERATYENGGRSFEATGYRLADPTAALGAFEWQRPAGATASKLAALAAETPKSFLAVHGNLLFAFDGYKPTGEELVALVEGLRNVDTSALPALPGFLPGKALPGSERYIVGPVGLEKFSPGIPPSVAAFSMGAEAQVAGYKGPKGDMKLALFNYPTPQIAMQRFQEFQGVPGVMVKRSGPIVAAIVAPADRDAAEKLLAEVRYEAQITLNERMPTKRDNIGDLIVNAFILIGILFGFSVVAGLAFGGVRVLRKLASRGVEPEAMITLHIESR